LENLFVVRKGGVLKIKYLLRVLKVIWEYYLFETQSHWRLIGIPFAMPGVILAI